MDPNEELFFRQGDELSEEVHSEPPEALPQRGDPSLVDAALTADAKVRRVRLRRVVVGALLASTALFAVGVVRRYGAPHWAAPAPKRRATLAALRPAMTSTPADSANGRLSAAPPSASAPASSEASPASEHAQALDAAALTRRARLLLEGGHTRDGVAAARSAVNANPRDAEPYVLLAAGLQDLGRWAEAQAVFATCKQATSSGPNATCRYFAAIASGGRQ